jgi:hypothetical protein
MFAVRQPLGPIEIDEEQRFVIGTGAILDDEVANADAARVRVKLCGSMK